MLPHSGRRSIVVVQQTTEPLLLLDYAGISFRARFGAEESITQTLMVALGVIQVSNRAPIWGN
jgi:hypothetical protein